MSPAKEVTRSGMELYTKKGDGGRASTITRMNIPKNSPIFELLGTLDEFTSALGVAKRKAPASLAPLLEEIQGHVIALNGELAGGQKFATGEKVRQLEAAIDSLMENVPPFSGFILPGGSEGGAALDLARAVARRAERCAVAASQTGGVNRDVLAWMNRLSDLLYALARVCDRMTPAPAPAISPAPVVSDMTAPVMASALTADGFCDQAAALCRAVRLHAREQGLRVVAAVCDAGGNAVVKVEVPAEWANIVVKEEEHTADAARPDFVKKIVDPINALKGDLLPVSAFNGREDGTWDNGTAAYEKRGIAVNVPEWKIGNCIQCNQCAYVCPHAVIRPFLATEEEAAASGVEWKQGLGETKEYKFRIQISPMDCTGCSNCVDVCPAKDKALVMRPLEEQMPQQKNWDYITKNIGYKQVVDKTKSVKNLQFAQPLFEFSGACAGCGETPYIKAISQLFGDKMMVANATGCTSIYSGSAPSTPYCTNAAGQGPAWANSLFEDNAEFGLGMHVGVEKLRDRVQETMEKAIANCTKCSEELKAVMKEWIENRGSSAKSAEVTARLIPLLEACGCDYCKEILEHKDWLVKKSQWIIGGDGWGYDIGYGGVDHVLATGQDVNILVVDTEVYSNTGGQSSKSTPVGAVAKFASSGKRIRKKDLGAMAMTYGYVYVAQVSIGASQQQLFNVLKEAEAYPGPSLVIAYAPCINHGIKGGMTRTQTVGKEAVACGYWHLWHYNPLLEEQGKNPFVLDSKEPDWSKFREFLLKEVRYTSLQKSFPAEADELFAAAEENAKWRYNGYKRLAQMEY